VVPWVLFVVAAVRLLSFGLEVVGPHDRAVPRQQNISFAAMLALVLWAAHRIIGATRLCRRRTAVPDASHGRALGDARRCSSCSGRTGPRCPRSSSPRPRRDGFWAGERLRWLQDALKSLQVAQCLGAVYPLLFGLDILPGSGQRRSSGRLSALKIGRLRARRACDGDLMVITKLGRSRRSSPSEWARLVGAALVMSR